MLRFSINSVLLSLACLTVACSDPCLPTFLGDGTIIAAAEDCAPVDTSTAAASTSGDGHSSTSAMATSTDGTSTGGACEPPADPPVCIGVPMAGEAWGRCFQGFTCNDGLECMNTGAGSVCLAPDDGCGWCETFKCIGGEVSNGMCAPTCDVATSPCPVPDMFCHADAGLCVYPELAPPSCEVVAGVAYGPCGPNNACEAATTCITQNGANVCAPFCQGAGICPANENDCTPATAPVCTSGAAATCGYDCTADNDCAMGQACSFNRCMWPI